MSQGRQTERTDLCAHLDYLFYGRVRGSLTLFPPLSEELWEKRFQANTNARTHTQRRQTGLEPKYQFKQNKCTNWPSQTCWQVWTNIKVFFFFVSKGHTVFCAMCVLYMPHLSLTPMRQKTEAK